MSDQRQEAVTKEAVFAAADKLSEEGKGVTLASVRGVCGGSYTTIGPWLKEWKAESKKVVQVVQMPEEITDVINQAGLSIWKASSVLADEKLAKERAAMEDSVNEAKSDAQEYRAEVARLESELEKQTDRANQAIESKEKVFLKSARLEQEVARLTGELNVTEKQLIDERSRNEQLQERNQQLQEELIDLIKSFKDVSKKH